jgi:hypothetical protein
MTKFIDQHPMTPFTTEQLREVQKAPEDEFGVTHDDILYDETKDKIVFGSRGDDFEEPGRSPAWDRAL